MVGAGGGGANASAPITDATITMAQGVLSAPQVEALKQIRPSSRPSKKLPRPCGRLSAVATAPTDGPGHHHD